MRGGRVRSVLEDRVEALLGRSMFSELELEETGQTTSSGGSPTISGVLDH